MKKLFLTSGLILCMTCSAYADPTDIDYTYTGNSGSYDSSLETDGCEDTYLDSYDDPSSLEAMWGANISGQIALDSNRYATSSSPTAATTASTAAGVTPVYSKYATGIYSSSANATAGTNAITELTTMPEMTGYSFQGFYTGKAGSGNQVIDSSGQYTSDASTRVSSDGGTTTFYAHWSPNTYTVTFKPNTVSYGTVMNGQSAAADTTQTFTYDATTNLTANPYSVTGYTFGGWTPTKNLTAVNGSNPPATYSNSQSIEYKYTGNDAELTAIWNPNISGEITLNSNIYPNNDHNQTPLYQYGEAGEPNYIPTAAVSPIYSKYNTGLYTNSGATTAATAANLTPIKAGYTFNGFKDSSGTLMISDAGVATDAGKRKVTAANGTDTWYAQWRVKTYNVTYAPGTCGGTSSTTNNALTYDQNYEVLGLASTNVTEPTGYTFDGWQETAVNPAGSELRAAGYTYQPYRHDGALTLTAQCSANTYKIKYRPGSHGAYQTNYSDSNNEFGPGATNGGGTYDAAWSLKTLSEAHINANTGYTFCGWAESDSATCNGNGVLSSGAQSGNWSRTSDLTLYAIYSTNTHSITYTCGTKPGSENLTSGTAAPSPQNNVAYGSTVSLEPVPGTCEYKGWHFAGWKCNYTLTTGDPYSGSTANYAAALTQGGTYDGKYTVLNTGSSLTFNTDHDVTCDAMWAPNTISLNWNPDGGVNQDETSPYAPGTGTGSCNYDGSITLPQKPRKNGYKFQGWTVTNN